MRLYNTFIIPFLVLLCFAGPAACGGGGSAGGGEDPWATPSSAGGEPSAPIPGGTSYGFIDSSDTLPSWPERTLGVFVNAARMDPVHYRDNYMTSSDSSHVSIMQTTSYPAVPPVYYSLEASVASRYHANDRVQSDCDASVPLLHSSCDGTTFQTRWGNLAGTVMGLSYTSAAEVVATRKYTINNNPLLAVNHWLCDGLEYSSSPPTFSDCPADGSGTDGHRAILLGSGYNISGAGYAVTSDPTTSWRGYWVMNPAHITPGATPPIVDGSHLAIGATLTFFMNYFDGDGPPREVRLVLEGNVQALTLELGMESQGTYTGTAPDPGGCAGYHFEALDVNGTSWRYPGTGELMTYGIGGCREEYQP